MVDAFVGSIDNLKRQIAELEAMSNQVKSISNPEVKQSPVVESPPAELASPHVALLKLYDEFIKTDEGKALAANLQRFARYAQSKQNKLEW